MLNYIPQGKPHSFEREVFPNLLESQEPMYGVVSDRYWIDIGTTAKYLEVHRDILNGKFQSPDIPTNRLDRENLPEGASIDDLSIVAEGVTIREGVRIENSVIGSNCKIDARAHIADSVIWSSNTIDADARISGALLGRGCYIGRSAVLKPGAVLGGNAVVTEYSSL